MKPGDAHLRIARPTQDLQRIRDFYVDGLGMSVLYEGEARLDERHWELLMCGFQESSWHLEFTRSRPHTVLPSPTSEDLLVFYLDDQADVDAAVESLRRYGGTVVPAENPYWDEGGLTLVDPDGYRLVVTTRRWG